MRLSFSLFLIAVLYLCSNSNTINSTTNYVAKIKLDYQQNITQLSEENQVSSYPAYNTYKTIIPLYVLHIHDISYIFFGIMIAFLFIHMIFTCIFHTKKHVYSTLLVLGFTIISIYYANIHDLPFFFLDTIVYNNTIFLISLVSIVFVYILLSKKVLTITKYIKPSTTIFLQLLLYISIVMFIVAGFSPYTISSTLLSILLTITSLFILYTGFIQLMQNKSYILYSIYHLLFTIFAFTISLSLTNYLQLGSYITWYFLMGTILSFCGILTLCIVTHMKKNRNQKLFTQQHLMDNAKQVINQQREIIYAYTKFVPKELISFLNIKNISQIQAGDIIKNILSVIHIDIANLSQIISTLTIKDTALFLTLYNEHINTIISQDSGYTIRHANGSNTVLFKEHSPEKAIRVAEQILQTKILLQKEIKKHISSPIHIQIHIGITIGKATFGIIGKTKTLEAMLLSNEGIQSINMKNLNKIFKTECIISKAAYTALSHRTSHAIRLLPTIFIKGLEKEKGVYELFGSNTLKIKYQKKASQEYYHNAISLLYKNKLPESINVLEIYQKKYPHDITVKTIISIVKKQVEKLKLRY